MLTSAPRVATTHDPDSPLSRVVGGNGPVRVLHVVYRLQAGGMELGVVKLVNGLDPSRVRSAICSTTPATDVKTLLDPRVSLFEGRRRAGNDPRIVAHLARLFRREAPHIVHTHAWGTLLEGMVAARLARVPSVIHGEHGTMELRPLQLSVQRLAWSRADRVLSVSSRLADRMSRVTGFPRERITVVRNGVDTVRFARVSREEARAELGLGADVPVIGTVGRLVPVKNQASLVEAVAGLRRRGVRALAVIAGDGPLRSEIEAQIESLGLGPHVRLLGHRSDPETVLAALDVFVLPSRSEGLSNTILEAMAAGLPVVAAAVGGNDELIEAGVTGMLVPPESSEALADAIAALLTDQRRRSAMSAAALNRARTTFSLEAMIANYERVYLEAARALRSARG